METMGKAMLPGMRALTWCISVGLYLLCAGSLHQMELVAAVAAATIVTALAAKLRVRFLRTLEMKGRWLTLLWRIPPAMFQESWFLLIALLQRLAGKEGEGRFIEHQCPRCEYDHHDSARRAFMTFGVCITPNSYLVSYDPERKRVLLRQLVGRNISPIDRLFVELP
jgi:hypothetical protein